MYEYHLIDLLARLRQEELRREAAEERRARDASRQSEAVCHSTTLSTAAQGPVAGVIWLYHGLLTRTVQRRWSHESSQTAQPST